MIKLEVVESIVKNLTGSIRTNNSRKRFEVINYYFASKRLKIKKRDDFQRNRHFIDFEKHSG